MSTVIEGFSVDNFGFYKDEESFYPVISSSSDILNDDYNTFVIDVDLSKGSDLDFSKALELAKAIADKGKFILWNVNFNLIADRIDLHFEGYFSILNRGFTCFLEKLVQPYLKQSFGICLFEGSIDLVDYLPWNTTLISYFNEWIVDEYGLTQAESDKTLQNHLKRVFLINSLSEYLHRFSSKVFDEILSFVNLDTKIVKDQACLYQMLSKKRFNHIHLILSHHKIPLAHITQEFGFSSLGYLGDASLKKDKVKKPIVGVCFPEDEKCHPNVYLKLNEIFEKLNTSDISFRIFPEYDGMHDWDELEYILVLSNTLTTHGKRVLQGFSAAMGQVVYIDQPSGITDEISFEEFLKKESG